MNISYYTKQGFKLYGRMIKSDRYNQGIDIELNFGDEKIKDTAVPAVYILANENGDVLKLGQTSNLKSRIYSQYKSVINSTNNRIRTHVRDVEDIFVYVYTLPILQRVILDRVVNGSFAKGLEYQLLSEYADQTGQLPLLNTMKR